MSKYITEEDISLGYSSEPDEYESEHVQDLLLAAEPFEIYVGNTGKVPWDKYFSLFKQHGIIEDMSFWRTHDHLYHARIVYQSKAEADKAIEQMNNRMFFTKRIRVTYAKKRVSLDFRAAIRIDDICADVSEEDIFDHFLPCGDIRFVIKTGYAAYIQFASAPSAVKALGLEMILNGDPYSLTRISVDDKIDHVQAIENMKDIKYRKPFVIVENYPELPSGTPLCRYKSNFESVGPVRHFKIAPTANGTVTLALCMDKADDRDLVIDRFNNTVISDTRLKLYMAPGKARMTVEHVDKYAISMNSITADNIPPYFKDYDVCRMFRRCGLISFLERTGSRWIICFDSPSAVPLARNHHIFSVFKEVLKIDDLTQDILPDKKPVSLQDADANKTPEEEKKKLSDDLFKEALKKMEKWKRENIKQSKANTDKQPSTDVANKQQILTQKVKKIEFKIRNSLMNVKATPVQPKPPTSQPMKRPANDNGANAPSGKNIKHSMANTGKELPLDVITKQQTLAHQAKQIEALFKTRDSLMDVKATPVQPNPPASQSLKRPANDNGANAPPTKNINQIMTNTGRELPPDVATKQQTLAHLTKQIDALFKIRDSFMDVKATPVQPKPSSSQPMKCPANDIEPKQPPHNNIQQIMTNTGMEPMRDVATNQQTLALHATPFYALFNTRVCLMDEKATQVQPNPSSLQTMKSTVNVHEPNAPPALTQQYSKINFDFQLTLANLPKGIEENDLRELCRDQEIRRITLFCSKDPHYPTSVAFINLISKPDTKAVIGHHHDLFRGKRVCIHRSLDPDWHFLPDNSLMLKNLPKNVTEEGIAEMLEGILGASTVVDVLKPTHHYAYVEFKEDRLRIALPRFKIDVFPLYGKLLKTWMNVQPQPKMKTIDQARSAFGAMLSEKVKDTDMEFGVHNAHKLFVGNIPRDTQAEDVIDYFNNFGSVIDYAPIEKKSCFLRKSTILSFINSKHAQNAYCQHPHYLEGSELDVHLMDSPPLQFNEGSDHQFLTVKFHSRFLTNDEIRHTLQKVVNVFYNIRFDAFDDRANYVARYKTKKGLEKLPTVLEMQYINDEAVKIVQGYDPTPPKEDEAREREDISNSSYRRQKENYLNIAINTESLKNDIEVRSRPNKEGNVPFNSFYNDNSVQINNVSLGTTVEDIRDLFIKCGDIDDYRALLLKEDASKICYVKFKIDLAADLACTYNQRMINGKRILVHLAKETLLVERERSILVVLNPATTAEQVHDAFTPIGTVKYVQKQSPFSAIVCFKDKDSVLEAVKVKAIPNSGSFTISPCYEEYDPRFFNNFSCQEEVIPIERMRAALKPRVLPEFHQLELEQHVFETLPDQIKTRLINEVFVARKRLPNFNMLTKHQQINALKTEYQDFTHKEHFLLLTNCEQEKLLQMTSNLQQDYPYEEVIDLELFPPAPKQTRNEDPLVLGSQQKIEPLRTTANASHVAQALPTSGLLGIPANNPPPMAFPQPSNMFQQGGGPRFPNMYPQQGPPPFAGGMPQSGGPNQPMMGPGHMAQALPTSSLLGFPGNIPFPVEFPQPGNMFLQKGGPRFPNVSLLGPPPFAGGMPPFGGPNRSLMGPGPGPMVVSPQIGGIPTAGPQNDRWIAAMAYNAMPPSGGLTDFIPQRCNFFPTR